MNQPDKRLKAYCDIKSPKRRCAKCKHSKPVKGFRAGVCADCQQKKEEEAE